MRADGGYSSAMLLCLGVFDIGYWKVIRGVLVGQVVVGYPIFIINNINTYTEGIVAPGVSSDIIFHFNLRVIINYTKML